MYQRVRSEEEGGRQLQQYRLVGQAQFWRGGEEGVEWGGNERDKGNDNNEESEDEEEEGDVDD